MNDILKLSDNLQEVVAGLKRILGSGLEGEGLGLPVLVDQDGNWSLGADGEALIEALEREIENLLNLSRGSVTLTFAQETGLGFQLFDTQTVDQSFGVSVDLGKKLFEALGVSGSDLDDILDLTTAAQFHMLGQAVLALGFNYNFKTSELTRLAFDGDNSAGTGFELQLTQLGASNIDAESTLSAPDSVIDSLPESLQPLLEQLQVVLGIKGGSLDLLADGGSPFATVHFDGSALNSTLQSQVDLLLPFYLGVRVSRCA